VNSRKKVFIKPRTYPAVPKVAGVALLYSVENALPHFAATAQRITKCCLMLKHRPLHVSLAQKPPVQIVEDWIGALVAKH
jgi:hypothetical protein